MIFGRLVHRSVAVAVLSVLGTHAEGSALPITVAIRLAAPAPDASPVVAQLAATPTGGSVPHVVEPVGLQQVTVPGSAALRLEAGVDWEVVARTPGFWCESKVLRPSAGASAELVLYRSGFVAGSVQTADDVKPPGHLTVRLTPGVPVDGTRAAGEPEAEVTCPVTNREYRCETPAGLFDLRVGSAGFVPNYFWRVTIPPSQVAKLPLTVLRKGSSVSGWVVFAVPAPQRGRCQVELSVAVAGQAQSVQDEARRRELTQRTTVNERGFFQFGAVQPGRYVVTARAPGLIAAESGRVDVSQGLETQLMEPIRLAPPVRLTLLLDPPRSVFGDGWMVSLAREENQGEHFTTIGETSTDETGMAKFDGLTPGTYALVVRDRRRQRWLDEKLTVESGMPPRFVHIPVLDLEGTLLLGKTPTEGVVQFSGKENLRRVFCFAREEGRFRCALPGAGWWRVDVQVAGDKARQELDPVEIPAPPPGSPATVEIVVPERPLAGSVVNERGAPVAGAHVRFVHIKDGHESSAVTNDDGDFKLRYVPLGAATVQAMGKNEVSETCRLTIEEGAAPEKVTLTLKPRAVLEGHVYSPYGPVAGAFVDALPDIVPNISISTMPQTTDVDGSFRIESLDQSPGANLIVVAPGFGARLLRVVLNPVAVTTIDVNVDQTLGAITVVPAPGAPQAGLPWFFLVHDGGLFTSPLLAAANMIRVSPSGAGAVATILNMAPGDYTACFLLPPSTAPGAAPAAPPSSAGCASGYLAPGGTLELKLGATSRSSVAR
jgi:hypothetical protein